MRPILYRAKAINRAPNGNYRTDYQNGDWVYGLVSRLDEYSAEMTNTDGISGIDVDRETICEWTGLTDKNGKKIFEGDIIRGKVDKEIIAIVEWTDKMALFSVREHGSPIRYCDLCFCFDVEVIGNKFDNPELLETK